MQFFRFSSATNPAALPFAPLSRTGIENNHRGQQQWQRHQARDAGCDTKNLLALKNPIGLVLRDRAG